MFRPQNMSASRELLYDNYQFKRTTFKIYEDGDTVKVPAESVETILIAKDWQRYTCNDRPHGGYISKGFSKYAFCVSILRFRILLC